MSFPVALGGRLSLGGMNRCSAVLSALSAMLSGCVDSDDGPWDAQGIDIQEPPVSPWASHHRAELPDNLRAGDFSSRRHSVLVCMLWSPSRSRNIFMVDTLYLRSTDGISLPSAKRIRLDPANYDVADMANSAVSVDNMDDLYGTPIQGPISAIGSHSDERTAPKHPVITSLSPPMGSIPGLGLISLTAQEPPAVRDSTVEPQSHTDVAAEDDGQGEPAAEMLRNDPVPTGTSDVPAKTSQLTVGEQVSQSKMADDEEFMRAAEANRGDASAEWQLDSSDAETSDTSSGSDSDSDTDDDEDDDEGVLLDPEEQARILMREEAADGDTGGVVSKAPLRTANEKPEEKIEKPNVVVTPDMKITELGDVEAIVDNLVLIKGKTSGEYQVLEMGSVLCLADRTVIGAVAETLGRVQEPRYAVGFTNANEVGEAGITRGTVIYYVDQHSTYVFTQPLRGIKGSDASNMHDEEVLGEEMEFSDDEAEAEYKRNIKRAKQAARDESGGRGAHSRIGRVERRGDGIKADYPTGGINYDDVEETDMYTPLARPENLYEMMSTGRAPVEERNPAGRGARGGRGRFGRGRDDRGGRGRRDHERGHHAHGNRDNRPERLPQNRRDNNERFDRGGRRGADRRQQLHHTSGPHDHGPGTTAQPQDPASLRTQAHYSPPMNQFPFMPLPNQGSNNWAQGNSHFAMPSVSPPLGSAPPSFTTPNGYPTSNGLPAGAYLNPAFMARQQQSAHGQQFAYPPHQPYQPQYTPQWPASQQQYVQSVPQPGVSHLQSPDTSAAHGPAQGNLAEILRGLTQNTKSS